MKTIVDIVNRTPKPAPWSEGDNIPWDDPVFSERMLAEHLSQEHDLASRRIEAIDEHVEWIFSEILGERSGRVLDLGCGPGLYTHRLAKKGCSCAGIDFSPASIRHATRIAAAEGLDCTFFHRDLREGSFGKDFDLAMMVFGQFNVFERKSGLEILKQVRQAMRPDGLLLLEIQDSDQIRRSAEQGPSWYTAESGLFSDRPHLVLQENFWDENAKASTNRFMIIDGQTGAVNSYALSNEAYGEEELGDVLLAAGFRNIRNSPSLTGKTDDEEMPVFLARC